MKNHFSYSKENVDALSSALTGQNSKSPSLKMVRIGIWAKFFIHSTAVYLDSKFSMRIM